MLSTMPGTEQFFNNPYFFPPMPIIWNQRINGGEQGKRKSMAIWFSYELVSLSHFKVKNIII